MQEFSVSRRTDIAERAGSWATLFFDMTKTSVTIYDWLWQTRAVAGVDSRGNPAESRSRRTAC